MTTPQWLGVIASGLFVVLVWLVYIAVNFSQAGIIK